MGCGARLYAAGCGWNHKTMSQSPESREIREPHPETGQQHVPLLPRNPATQQLLIVGKRREVAEAKLEERLRGNHLGKP